MAKIKDPLPAPTNCDHCDSTAIDYIDPISIYGTTEEDWPWIWYCFCCGALVSCHPGTKIPMGKMADKQTRVDRARAHRAFDPLWKSRRMTRFRAYKWLAHKMGIPIKECHIAWFNSEQCKEVIRHCEDRKRLARELNRKMKDETFQ